MRDNPVQTEYIVMEEVVGRLLAEVWSGMDIRSKGRVVSDLVSIEKKLLSVFFSRLVSRPIYLRIMLTC